MLPAANTRRRNDRRLNDRRVICDAHELDSATSPTTRKKLGGVVDNARCRDESAARGDLRVIVVRFADDRNPAVEERPGDDTAKPKHCEPDQRWCWPEIHRPVVQLGKSDAKSHCASEGFAVLTPPGSPEAVARVYPVSDLEPRP